MFVTKTFNMNMVHKKTFSCNKWCNIRQYDAGLEMPKLRRVLSYLGLDWMIVLKFCNLLMNKEIVISCKIHYPCFRNCKRNYCC